MALLKPTTKKRDIPHEPGEWMEFRRLPSLGGLYTEGLNPAEKIEEYARYLLSAIVAWSYDEPPSIEAIAGSLDDKGNRAGGGLDSVTASWALGAINKINRGDQTDAELLVPTSPSTTA